MATGTLISEEEYLRTTYEPDCEFEDGVLIERNVGTEKHSWLQGALTAYFFRRRKAWNIRKHPMNTTSPQGDDGRIVVA